MNDGFIELGTEATLIEPLTDRSQEQVRNMLVRDPEFAFTDNNIAGPWLIFHEHCPGQVAITRGHEPLLANGNIPSIARWYRLDAAPVQGEMLDIAFHYETSELNGANASDLVMHKAPQSTGNWYALPSISQVGAQLVSVTDPPRILDLFPAGHHGSVTNTLCLNFTVFSPRPRWISAVLRS